MNERKIVKIIIEECKTATSRYKGYRDDLSELVAEIINLEQKNRVVGTNIQQKISDKCNALSLILVEKRGQIDRLDGDVQ